MCVCIYIYSYSYLFIKISGCAGSSLLCKLFSSVALVVVCGLLIAVVPLVEHGLCFGSCSSWALEHRLSSRGSWA